MGASFSKFWKLSNKSDDHTYLDRKSGAPDLSTAMNRGQRTPKSFVFEHRKKDDKQAPHIEVRNSG